MSKYDDVRITEEIDDDGRRFVLSHGGKRIVANSMKECLQGMDVILDLPDNCRGKTLNVVVAQQAMKRGHRKRDPHDFFPTPPEVTRALLAVEQFVGGIWEPACGDGAMSMLLEAAGYLVRSSDKIDRGYGEVEDFLTTNKMADNIVTNPPFNLMDAFVEQALARSRRKVALFLPLTFLEGQNRNGLLRHSPLKSVHIFCNRVSLYRNGSDRKGHGRFAFAWYAWEHGYEGRPQIDWISTTVLHVSFPGETIHDQ